MQGILPALIKRETVGFETPSLSAVFPRERNRATCVSFLQSLGIFAPYQDRHPWQKIVLCDALNKKSRRTSTLETKWLHSAPGNANSAASVFR
jgi:hypothetical protein